MLDFPGPGGLTLGQVFTSAGKSWQWDGAKWGPAAGGGAPLDSPSFTGDPKAPTPATADNDTSIATSAFVKAQGYLTGNQSITLSGDITGAGTTAIAATLATVNANVGTFQGLTVNAKGQVTAASNQSYVTGGPYLSLTGGTLSGGLGIQTAIPGITLEKTAGNGAFIQGRTGVNSRWLMYLGDNVAEGGSNAGSNFAIYRYTDAGASVDAPLTINRATGAVTINGNAGVSEQLQMNGTTCGIALTATAVRSWLVRSMSYGDFSITDNTAAAQRIAIKPNGDCYSTNGTWSTLSDARTKRGVVDYTTGLAELIQLRPVTFSYNGELGTVDDGVTRYGLIAQDVEPIMPELVGELYTQSERDAVPNTVKTVDSGRAIYAVMNALREINARLEALEARLPPAA